MYVLPALSAEYGLTGYGCQSCSSSAEQRKRFLPCPRSRLRIWSRDLGTAVPSRVSPLILHTYYAEPGVYSRGFCRFPQRRPHIPSNVFGSVPSLSGHAAAYRWRSLPTIRRYFVSSLQASSTNGSSSFRSHRPGSFFVGKWQNVLARHGGTELEGRGTAVRSRDPRKKRAGEFDKLVDWAVCTPLRELPECRDTENCL